MRLGLMGGTFDPPHYGHLVIAEEARLVFGLDRVDFVTSADPPHKQEREITPAEHRYAMTLLSVASNPFFRVSRREIERAGPSYSVDTLRDYGREWPGAELFFITGADAILEILTWRRAEEAVRLCTFIAATRPGYDLSRLERVLPPEYLSRVRTVSVPGVEISSTAIRERIARGKSIRYLVAEPVEQYIATYGLYREVGKQERAAEKAKCEEQRAKRNAP
jgi:nicotinate-nucleotide adenylyltransferase